MFKTKSFGLFIISAILIIITLIIATFWNAMGLGQFKPILTVPIIIAVGISVAGLVLGITEYKKKRDIKFWVGIIGNIIVFLFFVYIIIYSLK